MAMAALLAQHTARRVDLLDGQVDGVAHGHFGDRHGAVCDEQIHVLLVWSWFAVSRVSHSCAVVFVTIRYRAAM
jgi:hypothetical protein